MPSSSARSPFTLENIPYGVITTLKNPSPKCATAFEDSAVDLSRLEYDGFFTAIPGFPKNVFSQVRLMCHVTSKSTPLTSPTLT
jgi:fumarylacetoacetase